MLYYVFVWGISDTATRRFGSYLYFHLQVVTVFDPKQSDTANTK
jgi:hypothetical protein